MMPLGDRSDAVLIDAYVWGNAMKNSTRALVLGGIVGGAVFIAPAMALADEPVYPPVAPPTPVTQVLGVTVAQPLPAVAAATVATPSATLPFTGLDTMALVSAGVVLIAGGAALTVVSRKRRSGTAS
jgi:hypothetical protein